MTWHQLTKWYSLASALIERYPAHEHHEAIEMGQHDYGMRGVCSCGQHLRVTDEVWYKHNKPPAIQEHWQMKKQFGPPI